MNGAPGFVGDEETSGVGHPDLWGDEETSWVGHPDLWRWGDFEWATRLKRMIHGRGCHLHPLMTKRCHEWGTRVCGVVSLGLAGIVPCGVSMVMGQGSRVA